MAGTERNGTSVVNLQDGLLGLEESDQVMDMFARNMGVRVIRVDAEQEFLGSLAGINDPEQKRKKQLLPFCKGTNHGVAVFNSYCR